MSPVPVFSLIASSWDTSSGDRSTDSEGVTRSNGTQRRRGVYWGRGGRDPSVRRVPRASSPQTKGEREGTGPEGTWRGRIRGHETRTHREKGHPTLRQLPSTYRPTDTDRVPTSSLVWVYSLRYAPRENPDTLRTSRTNELRTDLHGEKETDRNDRDTRGLRRKLDRRWDFL